MTDASPHAQTRGDEGVILLNVLAVVAIASAVVLLMITSQETGVERSIRFREAAQATALARGGEQSAITALRRDMVEAPEVDHLRERWAAVIQQRTPIRGGEFALTVSDAQARFNVNSVTAGGLNAQATLSRVVAAAGMRPEVASAIVAQVRLGGPVESLEALAPSGVDEQAAARLSAFATALPTATDINIQTASPELLALVFNNAVAARLLVQRRDLLGYVTPQDLLGVGIVLPAGVGVTSDYFRVETDVRVGGTHQRFSSLIARRRVAGRAEAIILDRVRRPAGVTSRTTD